MVSVQLLYCDRLQAFQLAELFPELMKIQTKLGPHKKHFQGSQVICARTQHKQPPAI